MPAAQGTRRSAPAALGVSNPLKPGHDRQAGGSTPGQAHRGRLRDVTTVPFSSIFAREGNALQRNVGSCVHVQSISLLYCFACFLTISRTFDSGSSHTHLLRSTFTLRTRVM